MKQVILKSTISTFSTPSASAESTPKTTSSERNKTHHGNRSRTIVREIDDTK